MTSEDVKTMIDEAGLLQYWPQFETHLKPAVSIQTSRARVDPPIGASKFGGTPDVPPGFVWPSVSGRALRFMGQLNMADLQGFRASEELPAVGLSSFFYYNDFYEDTFDGEFDDAIKSVAMIHTPDLSTLQRIDSIAPPTPTCRLTFTETVSAPDSLRPDMRTLFGADWKRYHKAYCEHFPLCPNEHQLLGYSGIDTNIAGDLQPSLPASSGQWRLLLRLEFDMNLRWSFGKGGTLFLMIPENDLTTAEFRRLKDFNWSV